VIVEIYKSAIAKPQAQVSRELIVKIEKDVLANLSAFTALQNVLNVNVDSATKSLTSLNFELGIPLNATAKTSAVIAAEVGIAQEAVSKALASLTFESSILKDAVAKVTSAPNIESVFSILEGAVAASQEAAAVESTFNMSKNAVAKAIAGITIQTISGLIKLYFDAITKQQVAFNAESQFKLDRAVGVSSVSSVAFESLLNVSKNAIVQATADVLAEVLGGLVEIYKTAVAKTQVQLVQQSTFNVNKDAITKTDELNVLESLLKIDKESIIRAIVIHAEEIMFNVRMELATKALADAAVGFLVEIYKPAVGSADAQSAQQLAWTVSRGAIQNMLALTVLQTTLSLTKESVAKSLVEFSLGTGALASFPLDVVLRGEDGIAELEGEKGEIELIGENGEVTLW
jgi:hypothetical protein